MAPRSEAVCSSHSIALSSRDTNGPPRRLTAAAPTLDTATARRLRAPLGRPPPLSRNALIALMIALGLAVVAQNAEMRSISRSDAGGVVHADGGQAVVNTGSARTAKDG